MPVETEPSDVSALIYVPDDSAAPSVPQQPILVTLATCNLQLATLKVPGNIVQITRLLLSVEFARLKWTLDLLLTGCGQAPLVSWR